MAIVVDETRGLITLHTRRTSYQMKVDEIGTLLHTHYGARIADDDDLSLHLVSELRGFSSNPYELAFDDRSYALDQLPVEYSTFGTGDYRATGLKVENADGSQTLSGNYKLSLKFYSNDTYVNLASDIEFNSENDYQAQIKTASFSGSGSRGQRSAGRWHAGGHGRGLP